MLAQSAENVRKTVLCTNFCKAVAIEQHMLPAQEGLYKNLPVPRQACHCIICKRMVQMVEDNMPPALTW